MEEYEKYKESNLSKIKNRNFFNFFKLCIDYKNYKSFKSGYTLTEVLISIILISFILAVSTPIYYKMATILPKEATLAGLSQKLFYLLSDARKTSVLSNNIICISYSNKTFQTFVDNDLNGVSDDNKVISTFNFEANDYRDVKLYFNRNEITGANIVIYVIDGVLARRLAGDQIDLSYSNSQFQFVLGEKAVTIRLDNSLPKIEE